MIEQWTTTAALQVHAGGAAVQALNVALEGHLAAPIEVTTLTALVAGDPAKGTLGSS
jgi:quinol monooxygenase YgiN